ncbi:MAG: hypothetical protein IJZ75_06135 [Clostridia bacterium]|nr:hypothetical protein [Clostridia bacterium]
MMKKFIKKHLSVILSFAIILGTVLPVLSGVLGVSALSAEEQAVVDQIKSGWAQMTTNPTSVLYPNYTFPNNSKTHMGNNIHTTAAEATLPYGATADMLGTYYVTNHDYTVTYTNSGTNSTQRILFYGNIDNANDLNANVSDYDGFYFYIYFAELSAEIKITPLLVDGNGNSSGKAVTVTTDKQGQWVKLSDTDLFEGGMDSLTSASKLRGLQLNLSSASGSATVKATVGSLQFVKNAVVPADSETADWSLSDWLKAALEVNTASYGNTDAFTAALAAAKTAFAEKYAIATVRKEWEALSTFHDPDINPNRWWNTSGTVANANMAEASTYTGALSNGVDLGANFASFTGLGNAATVSSKQCILFEFMAYEGGQNGSITSGAKSLVAINTMDDIYFWLKADNLTADMTLNIQVMTNDSGMKTHNLDPYIVPAAKSGEWIKVSLKEIGGDQWYGTITDKLYRFMVAMNNANGATVTVGSGKIVLAGACPVPANVADTADAWLEAAKTVNLSAYIDTTAFVNAVDALKVFSSADPSVELLKQEWKNLEYVGTPDNDGFKVGIWQNGGTTLKESNTGATQLVYDTNVDTTYGEYQFTATGVASSTQSDANGSAYFRISNSDDKATASFAEIADITFWYKASGNAKARIGFVGGNATAHCNTFKNVNDVTLTGDGNWKLYSVKELIGDTAWQSVVTLGAELYLQRLQINLATFDDGVSSIDVSFGALHYTLKDTSLDGSDSWTNEQWVDNAEALDLSNYKNTAAFEAAMYAAIESVYGLTRADLAAMELIAAWSEMSQIDRFNLLPNRWYDTTGAVKSTGMAVSSAYTEALPEGVELGSNFTTLTGLGNAAAVDSKQCVILEFKDSNGNTFNGRDRSSYNVTELEDIYFWVKLDNLTADATLSINTYVYPVAKTSLPSYTIPAAKSGEWVKVSLKEVAGDNWYGTLTDPLFRVNVAFANVEGATVTLGSGLAAKKVGAPANAANMEPAELLMAAMALDLSAYGNTEKFVEKLNALKLLCEEEVAISELKKATSGLSQDAGEYLYPRRYWDADGTICSADTYAINASEYTGTLPEGADATNLKSYLGDKIGVISSLTDTAAAYKTSGNKQTVLYELNNGGRSTFTAGQIADMYFWYKLEGAASAKIINGIYVIGENGNANPTKLGGEITLTGDGQWHKITFSEVYGANWVSGHDLYDGKVYRLIMSIGEAEGGTITLGSIVTEASAGLLPDGNESWTLSDWIYAVSNIDYVKYKGAEAFEEALEYAIEVRDRLQVGRGVNLSVYDDGASADVDAATLGGTNILESLIPVIEHSADGNTKNEVASAAPELFTDGDSVTVGSVTGLDNSDEASFTDFTYQFAGAGNITDLFIYNDNANIADKYYIYVADTRSELFTQANLLVPYTNEEGKLVQRFNFDGKPNVSGMYLGIRVFGDTDSVSFAEFKAYGEVIAYDLEKGNFSNSKIESIGENLLVGKTPKIKTALKFDWSSFFGSNSKYKPEMLTDTDNTTPIAVYGSYIIKEKEDSISVHFYYDLGTTYTIDKLFINHWDNKGLETGKYEIYASRDVNSLFMSRNMLLSYDNTAEGPNETTVSQLFTLKNEVIARYISFHITYPISDWDYCETQANYGGNYGIRLSEFGVYGTEWVKPYALVNLTSHVPMDVFRTDANGVTKEVGDSEYNGIEHQSTYDGNNATFADIKIKDGETLNFVYNLAAEMTLEEICMKLGVASVKRMNIYASTVEDAIWESSSLIYSENDGLGETYFGKGFAGSPIKARYIRFEILENDGEDLIIDEMSAIGGNDQEFTYMNLVEENPESASFYLQDKATGSFAGATEHGNKWLGSWSSWNGKYPLRKAFDNDNDSVYDLFGGKNGEESVNILLDLGTLNAIDDITLVGGSTKDYWPDELNFYFGDDSVALFDKDAKPAKSWTQSVDDAYFTYEFVPQVAQYVRIEFLRGENEVYSQYFDHIGAIIGEIQVNGLELKSRAVNGIAATVVDEATGIKAEILALRDNDVYDTIQDIMVIKRAATTEETASAKESGLKVATDVYEIYFLDVNGDIVTDTGGREVAIYLPESLYSTTEDIFVLQSEYGGLSMIEFDNVEGYYKTVVADISSALAFALGYMVEEEFEPSEDTEDTNNDVFDEDEEETEEEEEEEEEEETKRRKKIIKVRKKGSGLGDYLWIIIVVAVVVVAAGVTLIIILAKKKKKNEEEDN